MLDFFGSENGAAHTHQVRTEVELESVLSKQEFVNPKGVHVSPSFPLILSCFVILHRGSVFRWAITDYALNDVGFRD